MPRAKPKTPAPRPTPPPAPGLARVEAWFAAQGRTPWPFQRQAWALYGQGRSGLVQVPTGSGKTFAAYLGPLADLCDEIAAAPAHDPTQPPRGLRILYVSPLRAVSRDITLALQQPASDLNLPIRVEARTGDTSSSLRAKQKKGLPEVLVTTPESLTILLTQENARDLFAGVTCTIVDEWHELLSSKRGTQMELALARLRRFSPRMRTWGLSATIANADEAARTLIGAADEPVIVTAPISRQVIIRSILPDDGLDLPWAGHLGLKMLPLVADALDPAVSTLIFTNTRSQAELWHRALTFVRPEWEPVLALHHGSIDRDDRERIEAGVKSGDIRMVVATSSLDLGVDFAPVERVVQIGSPKGVGRLVQRAGRASHRPGVPCEIICVPTHALELLEIAAVRQAVAAGVMEARRPIPQPLDVLAQHLVSCALGGGFDPDSLYAELRTAWSYRDLPREEFDWVLTMVRDGGAALAAYDRYKKVRLDPETSLYRVPDAQQARLHRFNVGTIVAEATIDVRLRNGRRLGAIEENFVAWLAPGEKFIFAGRVLRFLGLHDLTCYVEPASGKTAVTPHWAGTKLPISESLSAAVRTTIDAAASGRVGGAVGGMGPELARARSILDVQRDLSILPREDQVLAEICRTREGSHLFLFPFEGRLVHAGLAAITALRMTRLFKTTFAVSANDYGFELLSADDVPFEKLLTPDLFTADAIAADALESVDVAEIAKIQFREIARVAGLVFQSYPGAKKSGRQTQVSASLIYDVFRDFDPGNLLLLQARREVLERCFERSRLARTMDRLRAAAAAGKLVQVHPPRPTPLAYPLVVERMSSLLSGETLEDRLKKMRSQWELDASSSSPTRSARPRVARKPMGLKSST